MDIEQFRKENSVTVKGRGVPKPLFFFEEAGFPGTLFGYLDDSYFYNRLRNPSILVDIWILI